MALHYVNTPALSLLGKLGSESERIEVELAWPLLFCHGLDGLLTVHVLGT